MHFSCSASLFQVLQEAHIEEMIKCVSKTSFASLLLQNCVVLRLNKNTIFKRLTTVAVAAAIIRYITNALDKRVFRMMTLQKCTCIRYRLINCDERRRSIESDMGWTMGQIHCNAKIKSKLRASYAGSVSDSYCSQ